VALQDQANQLQQMAESLPDLMWGCRADGSCDYVSRQWVEYTGIPGTEQLGYGWLERIHSEDREQVRAAWRLAVKSGERFEQELRLRGGAGAYRWFRMRAVPIKDAKGNIQKWYGASTDIDDWKRAEMARLQNAAMLEIVLSGMDEGYLLINDEGRVVASNPAAERMLARSALVGQPLFEVIPDLRGSAFEQKLHEAVASKGPFDATVEFPSARHTYSVRVKAQAKGREVALFLRRAPTAGVDG
jgi:PAS domain S-box-containing protein